MAPKITKLLSCGVILLTMAKVVAAESSAGDIAPNRPRNLADFAVLFGKSPFAMSSVAASSPLSQRFVITGAMMVNDTPNVFLLDKTTQDRIMISPDHPEGGVTLVSLRKDPDASLVRATIRVGAETGEVAFEKAPEHTAASSGADAASSRSASPPAGVTPPATASAPSAPPAGTVTGNLPAPPPRTVIRRHAPPVVPASPSPTTP